MSATENLESLTNDQLHHRMLALGLPKMPVTDTTRGVLIKKIRNHLNEVKVKTRRETVAVVKYSSDEEMPAERESGVKAKVKSHVETNRRATLAAPQAVKAPQRRSGRITPTTLNEIPLPPAPKVAIRPSVYEIVEDSDEENGEILTQYPVRRSKSKSPSLSRSDIVTTSFKQVIEPVKESPEEDEEEEAMEVDEPPPKPPSRASDMYFRGSMSSRIRGGSENRQTLGGYYNSPSSVTSSLSYAPTRSTQYSSPTPPMRKSESRYIADQDYEAPYFSEFTRRLAQQKAKLLATSTVYSAPGRQQKNNPESVTSSIVAVFQALDQKFNLKRNLLILTVVLVVIFLFVLFLY
ncbi:hypothetical protein DMENIID0001_163800 [Sergentomyia squamirostris]